MGFDRRAGQRVALQCGLLLVVLLAALRAHAFVADPRELFQPEAGLGSSGDGFGGHLAARGDLVVAGAPYGDGVRGHAYVYREQRGRFVLEAALESPLPPPTVGFGGAHDGLGRVVATDAGRVLAGGTGLFLYTKSGATWAAGAIDQEHEWQDARLRGNRVVGLNMLSGGLDAKLCAYELVVTSWLERGCLPVDVVDAGIPMTRSVALAFDGTYAALGVRRSASRTVQIYRWEGVGLVPDAQLTRDSAEAPQTLLPAIAHWLALDAGTLALASGPGVELLSRGDGGWVSAGPSMVDLDDGQPIEETALDLRDGLLLAAHDMPQPPGPLVPTRHRASRKVGGTRIALALDDASYTSDRSDAVAVASATRGFFGLPLPGNGDDGVIVPLTLDPSGLALGAGEEFSAGSVGEGFGQQLAAHADRLLVIDPTDRDESYERRDGVWVPLGRNDPNAGHTPDPLATSLLYHQSAVLDDGDMVVALGDFFPYPGGFPGELQILTYGARGWVPKRVLAAPPGSEGRRFGASLATSGSTIVVGAKEASQGFGNAVLIYERGPGGWALRQTLEGGIQFGPGLALDGDQLAISTFDHIDLYRRGGEGWLIESSAPHLGGRFVLHGDLLAFAGLGNNDLGFVRVLERTATGWDRSFELTLPEGAIPRAWPVVAFEGDALWVSIDRFDGGEAPDHSGVARYVRQAEGWVLDVVLAGPDGPSSTSRAAPIVVGNGRVILGSPTATLGDVPDVGRVTTYTPGSEAVPLLPSTGGIWYDPSRSGEGWMFELLPDNRAFTIWFTYPETGSGAVQAWILGQGVRDGNRIVFEDAITTSGPVFGAGYDPAQLRFHSFGRMEFVFGTCGTGVMSYRTREGATRTRELQQLSALAGVPCAGAAPQGAQFDGTWYDPARTGEGVLLQFPQPDRAIATWFTYDAQGRQAWLIGDGHRDGSTVTFNVVRPVGTSFGDAFDAGDVLRQAFGTWTLHLTDCTHATLDYASPDPAFGSGSRQFVRLTQPEGTACQ